MPADNKIHFRCPQCDSRVSIGPEAAGKWGRCPSCKNKVQVPLAQDVLDFDSFLELCINELRIKTAAHEGIWQLSKADWDLNQDTGTITFTSPGGIITTCPVQIIGTFNTSDNSWMWGWDHPSVDPSLQAHARLCKAYGEKHSIRAMTAHKVANSTEDDGWQYTAMACKLAGAQGGYRAPQGTTRIYMTIGLPSSKKDESPPMEQATPEPTGEVTPSEPDA